MSSSPKSNAAKSRRTADEPQGRGPASLVLHGDSHKIQKPKGKPVIIYVVPPEVIHVEAGEFMELVQRLTGPAASPPSFAKASREPSASGRSSSIRSHVGKTNRQFPIRVKARALDRSGLEEALTRNLPSSRSPISPALFLHDLSRPSYGAGRGGSAPSPAGWWLRGEQLGGQRPSLPPGDALASPGYSLDFFSQASA